MFRGRPIAVLFLLTISPFSPANAQTADPPPYAPIANPLPDTMDHQRRDSVNLKFSRIRLNKAGYRPQDEKLFYYIGSSASSFSVVNLASGASAATGALTSLGATAEGQLKMTCYYKAQVVANGAVKYTMQSPSMSGTVYKGLIPDLPEGRYKITVGSEESAPFVIQANVYGMVKDALLKYFGIARCGPNDSWFHPACHLKDPVTGGWHDAGDHIKVAPSIGYTFAVLGLCAAALRDRDADHYAKNQSVTLITDGIPDVLIEAKVGADYLVNSYTLGGNSVAGMRTDIGDFGKDHGWWGRPEFQDGQVPDRGGPPRPAVAGLGGNTAGSFAAGLAFVGRLYAPYDAAYAAKCIKIAKELYAWGKVNQKAYQNAAMSGSDRTNDELAFGALALWWATKEDLYKNDLLYDKTVGPEGKPTMYPRGGFSGGWFTFKEAGFFKSGTNTTWADMDAYPLWGLYRLILIDDTTAASYGISAAERLNLIEDILYNQISNMGDVPAQNPDQTITLPKPDFGWKQNTIKCTSLWGWMFINQGSTWMPNRYQAGNITELFCYYDIASKIQGTDLPNSPATTDWKVKEVKSVLLKQLNYMLGMNPWDVSMIVGVGNKNLNHPHHRAATPELQNVPGTFYKYLPPVGALSGGYDPDPNLTKLYDEFMGGSNGYFHTEVSIDATTALFLPVMGLAKEDTLSAPSATVRTVYVGCDKAIIEIRQSRYGTSTIHYGTAAGTLDKSQASDSAGVFQTITLTGLTAGTTYYFNVEVKDLFGKDSTMLDLDPDKNPVPFSFTTPQTCPTNAQIPGVKICSVTSDSAEIFWYTPNGAFDSKVVYGTTKPPTVVHDGDNSGHPTNFHFVTIGGLKERTTYYFYVQSGTTIDDNNGQYYSFTTPVEHVEFDVRAVRYTDGTKHALGINIVNQDIKPYDSLEIRLYFRAKESDNFERDFGARLDIINRYKPDGFLWAVPADLQQLVWTNFKNQMPIKMNDTYDPADGTYAYYLDLPLWGIEMLSQARLRLDIVFNKRSPEHPTDLLDQDPDHVITDKDWSFGPHTDPIYFPGVQIGTKDDPDANYMLSPINYYITVYRKGEYIWGYSPSDSEQTTKKNQYDLKTQITSPLTNPSDDYVFFERTVNSVNVSGWATISPIDGTINDIWVNGVRIPDPSTCVKWNQAQGRYDFTVPVPVKNGRNNVDITFFAGPAATCQECYGCAATNHHFFIEFRGAKQYPSQLILKDIYDNTIASGDTVHIDTTQFNIIVIDRNGNLNGKGKDTLFASIVNPSTNDSIPVMLVESGDSTSQFQTPTPWTIVSEKTGDNQILMNPGDIIYVTYTDPSDPTDSSGAFVVTKADFPLAQRGWLLDANGDGRADSAVVIYNKKSLTAAPDSLRFAFPDTLDVQIVKQGQGAMTVSDNTVRVTFALPFDSATTAFFPAGRGNGVSYFTVQNVVKKNTFQVFDSIGPVIVSATAVERLQKGVDTLYVSFSEALRPQTIIGASLILIKNGVPTTIVVDTFRQISGGVYVVSLNTSSASPQAGDSLRINPEGPLLDLTGNHAHLLNRPVPLKTKEIPPSFVFAYYVDRDSGKADGIVDGAIITFDKKVKTDGLSLVFDWGANITPTTIQGLGITYVSADSTIVSVNLRSAFPTRPSPKTSGDMFVTSQWKAFPGQTDNVKVQDSAAPVIASASYLLSGEVEGSCDTLIVSFSEPVSITPNQNATPFRFLGRGNGSPYTLTVSLLTQGNIDTAMRFCAVSSIQSFIPKTGDSVWINPTANVADLLGNVQNNEYNRKVAFKVSQPNSELTIKVLRNPFAPGTVVPNTDFIGTAAVITTVNPKAKLQDLTGSVKIFDLLGNIVFEGNAVKKDLGPPLNTCYCFGWEGRNRSNRTVATGAYHMAIKYTVEGETPKEKWIRIGVKR